VEGAYGLDELVPFIEKYAIIYITFILMNDKYLSLALDKILFELIPDLPLGEPLLLTPLNFKYPNLFYKISICLTDMGYSTEIKTLSPGILQLSIHNCVSTAN
jgi:hypothetical protein